MDAKTLKTPNIMNIQASKINPEPNIKRLLNQKPNPGSDLKRRTKSARPIKNF
jgi:hypothetical protein